MVLKTQLLVQQTLLKFLCKLDRLIQLILTDSLNFDVYSIIVSFKGCNYIHGIVCLFLHTWQKATTHYFIYKVE